MKNSKALKTLLFSSGLIATGIGAVTLFTPVEGFGKLGVDLRG